MGIGTEWAGAACGQLLGTWPCHCFAICYARPKQPPSPHTFPTHPTHPHLDTPAPPTPQKHPHPPRGVLCRQEEPFGAGGVEGPGDAGQQAQRGAHVRAVHALPRQVQQGQQGGGAAAGLGLRGEKTGVCAVGCRYSIGGRVQGGGPPAPMPALREGGMETGARRQDGIGQPMSIRQPKSQPMSGQRSLLRAEEQGSVGSRASWEHGHGAAALRCRPSQLPEPPTECRSCSVAKMAVSSRCTVSLSASRGLPGCRTLLS